MAFSEDLSLFFDDFGFDVTVNGKVVKVLLNADTMQKGDGMAASVEYMMVYETALIPTLQYNQQLTIDNQQYRVNHCELYSDGKLSRAFLSKIES